MMKSRMTLAIVLSALTLIATSALTLRQAKDPSLAAPQGPDATLRKTSAEPKDKRPNRLIKEKSPYLLQHAYNPVDWFPWGAEAIEKARREDKPILISIGYSTC